MEFSDLYFLYILLPLTLLAYFGMPDIRRKNLVLVVVSFLFYSMGQPLYVLLLAGLSWLNFRFSLKIRPKRKHTLYLPLVVNIAVFVLLRYVDSILGIVGIGAESGGVLLGFVKKIVAGLNAIGMNLAEPKTLKPVGMPFYFLAVVSYFLDIYSGKVKAEKSLLNLLVYLTMFPKLAQGPIVHYEKIQKRLTGRRVNPRMIFEGVQRFITGLSKKVLLADYCARTITSLAGGADQTLVGAWLCALLYLYRIYFDFTGCCDMAVGLGRVFGFRFPENFDLPYTAVSVTEFTQKWNTTLRSFVREYVYIPLGGSHLGQVRQAINSLSVWLAVGLWHGGSLNYIVWALYFFVLTMMEKFLESQLVDLPWLLRRFLTMMAILFGWVFFAHEDVVELGGALMGMLGFGGFSAVGVGRKVLNSLPLILVCAFGSSSLPREIAHFWSNLCAMGGKQRKDSTVTATKVIYVTVAFGYMCLMLWLCSVSLTGHGSVASIFGSL